MSRGLSHILLTRPFQIAGGLSLLSSLYLYSSMQNPSTTTTTAALAGAQRSMSSYANNAHSYTPRHAKFPYTERDFAR